VALICEPGLNNRPIWSSARLCGGAFAAAMKLPEAVRLFGGDRHRTMWMTERRGFGRRGRLGERLVAALRASDVVSVCALARGSRHGSGMRSTP